MYDTVRWRKVAKHHLDANPLCVLCAKIGRDTAATIVDHIVPHNNDAVLFWAADNLQALCSTCHSGAKRMQEGHGHSQACDVNGMPIDGEHVWNKVKEKGNAL
jgi:5-methylcytosine-specific restriction endonuclease McrA